MPELTDKLLLYIFFLPLFFFFSLPKVSNAASDGPNLLFNSGFETRGDAGETDAADWSQEKTDGGTYLVSRTDTGGTYVKSGDWSLKQTKLPSRDQIPDSYGRSFIADTIGVVGGETYTIGGWSYLVKSHDNMDTGDFLHQLEIKWFDDNYDSVAVSSLKSIKNDTWEKWLKTSFDTAAPDTARFARFKVSSVFDTPNISPADTTTDVYWDSMFVKGKGPAPEKIKFMTQPGMTVKDETIRPLKLHLVDTSGIRVRWTDTEVSVEITAPGASLSGTTKKFTNRGLVVFDDLSVDEVGEYTLKAEAAGPEAGFSEAFEVINTIKNFQIGPNPFRTGSDNRVIMQFDKFKTDVDFEFEIYDLTGRKMDRKNYHSLSNNTGDHSQVYWYGADRLSSGHYIYRLKDKISGAEKTGQLVIIR